MRILAVIPSRYASTRLPAKPLADIGGKSMVRRVYEQALQAKSPASVVVATDDKRIYDHVVSFGGKAVMTRANHQTGTDRLCEIASSETGYDAYINIQGDEPFVDPAGIDKLCSIIPENSGPEVCTLVYRNEDLSLLSDPNHVKVVLDSSGRAMYFSRSIIPYNRTQYDSPPCFLHIGLYAFTAAAISVISNLKPVPLELTESLEQLRWMVHGIPVRTTEVSYAGLSVDSPADLERARAFAKTLA